MSFSRVKTLMKKTCLLSATNGPLSGAAVAGPGYRTLTLYWGTIQRVNPPETVCHWEPPPAAKVFWRTWVSRRSLLCIVRAVGVVVIGASAQKTPTAPTAHAQILQQCQTPLLSQCLTSPKILLTMPHYLIRAAKLVAPVPKISSSAWRRCAPEELWEGVTRIWSLVLQWCSRRRRHWRHCGALRSSMAMVGWQNHHPTKICCPSPVVRVAAILVAALSAHPVWKSVNLIGLTTSAAACIWRTWISSQAKWMKSQNKTAEMSSALMKTW